MRGIIPQKRGSILFCSAHYVLFAHFWAMEQKIHTDSLKAYARYLYVMEHKTLTEIEKEAGINPADLRRWEADENWKNQHIGILASKQKQIGLLYELVEKLGERIRDAQEPNPKDAELLARYTASIRNLDTRVDLGTINEVAQKFCLWLRPRNRELSIKVCNAFGDFLAEEARFLA
jgi:hypothetical protein